MLPVINYVANAPMIANKPITVNLTEFRAGVICTAKTTEAVLCDRNIGLTVRPAVCLDYLNIHICLIMCT